MITSIVCVALIGTLQFNSAISAAIGYEPIKITVKENFNAQPVEVSLELQEPGVLHQGAKFYFKPQLNLPPSHSPSHTESLKSLIQQHHQPHSKDASKVVVEKDKLTEILQPFMYPMSEISKETLSEIILEKENNLEIVKPIIITEELKPVTPELLVIPEVSVLPPLSFNGIPPIVEEQMKKEESIILEESTGVFPEPTIIEVEPKPFTSELVVIPEAPVLPPLSLHDIPSIADEEVKKEESIIFEEPIGMFPLIREQAVRSIPEQIIDNVESKPINAELVVIPEAPVLAPLSANDIHVIEEEFKEEVVDVEPRPTIPELVVIPEAQILPSLSLHDISSIIEEEVKIEEPIVVDVEPKPVIQELVAIPEAPVLPSLSFHDISSTIEEEVKKEELVIFEELSRVFPTLPEIDVRPIEELIIDYDEPKPITSEHVVIPEAPVLPPLSLNGIHPIVEEEEEKEESIILEAPTGVFSTISEIDVRPITEPITNYVESKPINAEVVVIPDAPVLPTLSLQDISSIIEKEVKKEESVIYETAESFALENNIFPIATEEVKIEVPTLFEESIKVFPPTVEISSGPTLQESEITDSYVLEEVSQPNPENVLTIKETLPPTIIPKPSNNKAVLSYVPFVSHLSNRVPKTKKLMIPKPASI